MTRGGRSTPSSRACAVRNASPGNDRRIPAPRHGVPRLPRRARRRLEGSRSRHGARATSPRSPTATWPRPRSPAAWPPFARSTGTRCANGRIEVRSAGRRASAARPSRLPRVLSRRRGGEPRHGAPASRACRDEALARRDAAMLELLYATGMRISELAGLTLDRARPRPAPAAGHRQGQQGAPAPLRGPGCRGPARRTWRRPAPMLAAAAARRSPRGLPQRPRRPAQRAGRAAHRGALGRRDRRSRAGRARTRCATRSPRTCSRAAPTCAWCRSCSATPTSQTTQIYTHLSDAALRSAYRDAHPRARAGAPGDRPVSEAARPSATGRPPTRTRGQRGLGRARPRSTASLILTVAALASRAAGLDPAARHRLAVRRQPASSTPTSPPSASPTRSSSSSWPAR